MTTERAAMAPIGLSRIDLPCPCCGATKNVPLTIMPTITYSQGPTKGFLTAQVAIGGSEHTCEEPEVDLSSAFTDEMGKTL